MPRKDLVAASSRPLLLGILAEGENYGYAIIQRVKELSGGTLQWTDGMLYPVLHRLEKEGLIASEWKTPEGERRRKYYRLASPGKRALTEERAEWESVNGTLEKLWNLRRRAHCPA
ncbi:MAG: helix-turn-helix transcriptional regulator [Verrucomicrobiota bacterium]